MGLNERRLAFARPDGSTLVSHGTQIRTVVPTSPYVAVGDKTLRSKPAGEVFPAITEKYVGFIARSWIDLSDATIENPLCRMPIL